MTVKIIEKPTEKATFTFEHDKLERKKFAVRLTEIIEADYTFVDGSYVLSLNSPFGTGKTRFLEMWECYLKDKNESKIYSVIYIDAWKDDFAQEPIVPILAAFLEYFDRMKEPSSTAQGVIDTIKHLLQVTSGVVEAVTNISIPEVAQAFLEKTELEKIAGRYYSDFKTKKKVISILQGALKRYVDKDLNGGPFFVLVDELDRARPNYSIEFLEIIKHIFSVNGMVFILAVDKNQLEASAKVLYGSDLEFANYYHRFAYANVSLPRPDDLKPFIKNLFEKRIRLKRDYEIDFIFDESMELSLIDIMDHLSIRLGIELREIEHVFRIFSYLMMQKKKENKKEDSRIVFNKIIIMLFLIMLSFSKIGKEIYVKLGRQEVDPKEFMIWLQTNMDINFDFATLGRVENFIYFLINKYNENDAVDLMYAQGKYKGTRDQFTHYFYSTYESILGERAIPKVQPVKQIHDKINLWKNIIED